MMTVDFLCLLKQTTTPRSIGCIIGTVPEAMARLDEIFDINHGRPLQKGEAPEAYSW